MAAPRGNTRKTDLEQCYTPAHVAEALVEFMVSEVGINIDSHWLEPAGGTGKFIDALHRAGAQHVTSCDVEPKHPEVQQGNFLELTLQLRGAVALTNPPFGRNHALSVPFFNRCAEHCDTIAFVVPRSWRKWSIVNRLDSSFVKVADRDLAVTYQDDRGVPLTQSSTLNTVFQVWQRSDTPRDRYPLGGQRQHFERVAPDEANVALTIFGRGCGTVRTEFEAKKNTTQMFIKANPDVVAALREADLSPFYTQVAYVEALARAEIDYAISEQLAGRHIAADYLATSTVATAGNPVPAPSRTGPLEFAAPAGASA